MHHLRSRRIRGASSVLVAAIAALSAFTVSTAANARSFRVNEIPNGRVRSCQTCHQTGGDGVIFNPFGSDVRSFLVGDGPPQEKSVDWSGLFARDSDGDGITNGAELGDPDGTWRIGDPDPGGAPSAPGDPNNATTNGGCGDGILGAAETCDSDQLRGATCENQNLGQGEMLCGLDCRLDTSNCDRSTEGDDGGSETGSEDGGSCALGGAPDPVGALGAMGATLVAAAALAARRRQRPRSSSRT